MDEIEADLLILSKAMVSISSSTIPHMKSFTPPPPPKANATSRMLSCLISVGYRGSHSVNGKQPTTPLLAQRMRREKSANERSQSTYRSAEPDWKEKPSNGVTTSFSQITHNDSRHGLLEPKVQISP